MNTCVKFKFQNPSLETIRLSRTKRDKYLCEVSRTILKELHSKITAFGFPASEVSPGEGCGASRSFGSKNARIATIVDVCPSTNDSYYIGYIVCFEAPPFLKTIFKTNAGKPTEEEAKTLAIVLKAIADYFATNKSLDLCKWMTIQEWCASRTINE